MNEGPRRLKDDPDFPWETGCDLSDEAFALGGYDLPGMRAKVLAATLPPSAGAPLRAGGTWPAWGGVVGVALVALGALVGASWLALATPRVEPAGDPTVPVAAQRAAPIRPTSAPPAPPVVVEPAEPAPTVPAPEVSPRPSRPATVPPVEADDGSAEVDPATRDEAVAPPAPPAPLPVAPPASELAEELAAYDLAVDAANGGRHAESANAFRAYLARWPEGRLHVESRVGLLFELVALGDHAGVETLAVQLVDLPVLAGRREEILRVRAENLVWLGRCEDAVAIARDLPSRVAADVRRACR